MRPLQTKRELVVSGSLAEGKFGISEKNHRHLITILRSTLYTNKILAVLREYSANAWDANREAGKGDVPIQVVLPTELDASLIIRDEGPGLSEKDIFEVYTKYGDSTKRDTNDKVGFLGIGSKSAFAYADTFTITSWHRGTKKVYVAVLDETDMGVVTKMHEEPCELRKTGVEIKVPVNPKDAPAFEREAEPLFRYFNPRPDINLTFEEQEITEYKSGFITPYRRYESENVSWIAVMGCIPYRLNFNQIWDDLDETTQEVLEKRSGGLFFEIGEVNMAASREELEYTDATLETIKKKIDALFTEILEEAISTVEEAETGWDRRLAVQRIFQETGIPLPKEHALARYRGYAVPVYDRRAEMLPPAKRRKEGLPTMPKHFRLFVDTSESDASVSMQEHPAIPVKKDTYIVIRDTRRALRRYLDACDSNNVVIARMPKDSTSKQVRAELKKRLRKVDLDGIPIKMLSELPERTTSDNKPLPLPGHNRKHLHKVFTLKTDLNDYHFGEWPFSSNWEMTEHQPGPGDLYVLLDRFDAVGIHRFFHKVKEDRKLLGIFKEKLPPIYGVKTSEKNPVTHDDVEGTHYKEWHESLFQNMLESHPRVRKNLIRWRWAQYDIGYADIVLKHLRPVLGRNHPIICFFSRLSDSRKNPPIDRHYKVSYRQHETDEWAAYRSLMHRVKLPSETNPKTHLAALHSRYPLLDGNNRGSGGFRIFDYCNRYYEDDLKPWIDYILFTDERNPLP